nr:hypothetical protein [Tanacetum cinerariifolium]
SSFNSRADVLKIDFGALGSTEGNRVGERLLSWVQLGCPSDDFISNSLTKESATSKVDIVLNNVPKEGLKGMLLIKQKLSLQYSASQLKEDATQVPSILLKNVHISETAVNLAEQYVLNRLGGAAVKRLGKWGTKVSKKLNLSERARSIANRIRCFFTGHPVDVISGYLYTEAVDFEFPGPLPLRWERLWYSTSIHAGALSHGWHHSYDLALVVEEAEGFAGLRGADGRGIAFDVPALGERAFNRLEKMSLLRDERGYGVLDHEQGLTYRFGPAGPDDVRKLVAVENANGFAITFAYDGRGYLVQIIDSAKRQFAV